MSNSAVTSYNSNFDVYEVKVNGIMVNGYTSSSTANTVRDRLNRIFSDSNRDLDFITPSYNGTNYVVCCPKVRKNVGEKTYFYDNSNNASSNYYPEKLYEPTNWENSSSSDHQTAILEIDSSVTAPWDSALIVANLIRSAIKLNFSDAAGRRDCAQLSRPSNNDSSVDKTIADKARCEYYGVPCQGSTSGTTSPCPEIGFSAENILNKTTGIGEVFHPQDLTAAMTSSNSWSSLYRNKYVKVTNRANSKSIVVRITDTAPANKGIELSYRAWATIGKPAGANTVKIELMR